MRYVRNSELASYRRCPRQWYLGWWLGKVPAVYHTDAKLLEGSAGHAGVEEYNRGGNYLHGIARWADELEQDHPDSSIEIMEAAKAAAVYLEAYPEWAESEALDVGKEIIGIEMPVEIPMGEDITIVGTLDRAVLEADGTTASVEDYKFVGDFRNRPIQADMQLLTYAQGLARVVEVPVTVGRHIRVKRNKRSSRANPPFFNLHENIYTPQQHETHFRHLTEWVRRLRYTITQLVRFPDREPANPQHTICPPNPSFHCTSPRCPYLDVCNAMDDGSDWWGMIEEDFIDRPSRADDVVE